MAKKTFVTEDIGGGPVPFLRGILTRSLNEAGLPFEQAYKVASDIRQELSNRDTVSRRELRDLVRAHLSERFPATVVEAYDAARSPVRDLLVRSASGGLQPFSRTEHLRCLSACGLGEEQARRVSSMLLEALAGRQMREITDRQVVELTQSCLESQFGKRVGQRYRVWTEFKESGRPVILLIGGTTGSGKSSVATELAHRLGIVRIQSTDMLREVMRMMIPKRLLPVLHHSSFDAWRALPFDSRGRDDVSTILAEGYMHQTKLVAVTCEAVVRRAMRERVSLILEGIHIHPQLRERLAKISDAVVVQIMLAVDKQEDLRIRLSGRRREAPERGGKAKLDNFERIWRLQAFLLSEADRTGVPIIINKEKDRATNQVLRTLINALANAKKTEREKKGD